MSSAEAAFVGRSAELETMQDLLQRAGVGAGRVALLAGEPGVGKTRLAREFAARAADRGCFVLWGAAYESATPPYGPWTQALTRYVEQHRGDLDAEAPVLAAVVPELGQRYPHVAPAPSLGSREEQFRLHDAVGRLLGESDRAVVLVLDDLQWADRATLELLPAVVRSPASLLVVATMRNEELSDALVSCLAELARERLLERLDIGRLSEDESLRLVERLVGAPVSPPVAAAIYEQAQGNPFFTEELARHAAASDREEASIPDTVRLAVAAHVRRLSQDAARVLGVAAVFTRPFEFRTLQALAELPEETVLDALDEALAAGLLRVARAEAESYEFGHDLVRQSLYDELNPSRRARLHRRAARALEQLTNGSDPDTAAELAAQYHRSASLPGAGHGVRYALAAAEAAEARHAPAEAARLLRIAHDLAGELGAAERAAILCRVGLSEADSLELEAARRTADEALGELAEAEAPPKDTAGFLWALARKLRDLGARDDEVRALVEQGLSLVGDEHGIEWARLKLVLRPAEPLESGRIVAERWLGYDSEAVRIARGSGDELDYASTFELMDWRDRSEVDELLERCRGWREPAARIHALSIAARTLLYNLGAFRDAEAVSRELLAESERAGSLTGTAYALEQIADVNIALGDFDSARERLAQARATAAALGSAHRVHFIIDFVETRLATYVGADWPASAEKYERAATDPATAWPWITIQAAGYAAFAYARAAARSDAARLLDELIPLLETLTPRTLNQNGAVGLAGAAVWELQDAARAEPCRRLALELVKSEAGDDVAGSNELTVARMASLLGRHDEADEWFERASTTLRADGRRPLQVVAVVDRAAAAIALPTTALREARDLADRLGMTAAGERAAALLEDAEATPPAGLTPREAEILGLLAGGRTNREIAETLVLSVHTVERHLANAYRKIGARNRADATAFAVREL
jgi:DNA-binding CsgD family transcriptional regulator